MYTKLWSRITFIIVGCNIFLSTFQTLQNSGCMLWLTTGSKLFIDEGTGLHIFVSTQLLELLKPNTKLMPPPPGVNASQSYITYCSIYLPGHHRHILLRNQAFLTAFHLHCKNKKNIYTSIKYPRIIMSQNKQDFYEHQMYIIMSSGNVHNYCKFWKVMFFAIMYLGT